MTPQSVFDWLFSDAGAGWVFGFVSVTVLIANRIASSRGDKITFKEVYKIPFMSSGKRIGITFDGNPVKSLKLMAFEVLNSASKVITPIELLLTFPPGCRLLEASCDIRPDTASIDVITEIKENMLRINLPYLNPFRAHREVLSIMAFLDGDFGNVSITGGGGGWSVTKKHVPGSRELNRRTALMSCLVALLFVGWWFTYVPFVSRHYGIPADEFSLRSFLASLPPITVFVLLAWVYLRWVETPRIVREISRRGV